MTDERQIEHLGVRPSWDCVACGNPWPCKDAKERLLNEFQGQRSGLAIYMSAQLNDAFADLTMRTPYPPPDLYDRFLSWIHPAEAGQPEASTHTESCRPPQAGNTTKPNLPAAGTPTNPTDSAARTDPPTQRRSGGNQPSNGNAEPPAPGPPA